MNSVHLSKYLAIYLQNFIVHFLSFTLSQTASPKGLKNIKALKNTRFQLIYNEAFTFNNKIVHFFYSIVHFCIHKTMPFTFLFNNKILPILNILILLLNHHKAQLSLRKVWIGYPPPASGPAFHERKRLFFRGGVSFFNSNPIYFQLLLSDYQHFKQTNFIVYQLK